jgi:hypothetical protein
MRLESSFCVPQWQNRVVYQFDLGRSLFEEAYLFKRLCYLFEVVENRPVALAFPIKKSICTRFIIGFFNRAIPQISPANIGQGLPRRNPPRPRLET